MIDCFTGVETCGDRDVFSCGNISRDLGAVTEAGCRPSVLTGADLAGVVALEPTVLLIALLLSALPSWERLESSGRITALPCCPGV